jgi:uncharacterized protein YjiK
MIGARVVCIALLSLTGMVACTETDDASDHSDESFTDQSFRQWKLPSRLREISGLAMTPDGRLFSVDDEKAVIYEIDYVDGEIVKEFKVGKPVLKDDFEGIAYFDEHLFLLTSTGMLYRTVEGKDGERVEYDEIDTNLGEHCEFEGLAQDLEYRRLLLVCKKMHDKGEILTIFNWKVDGDHGGFDGRIELPVSEILEKLDTRHLHPSGIAINPLTGSIVIVAARQRVIVEMDRNGILIDAMNMPNSNRHKQAEGIEVSRSGELIISDEGGKSRARLAVYSSLDLNNKN